MYIWNETHVRLQYYTTPNRHEARFKVGSETDEWKHVCAVTYSSSNITAYYNGQPAETDLLTGLSVSVKNNFPTRIGARYGDVSYFNGTIDELVIFNRTLTPGEVNQLYMTSLTKHNNSQWYLSVNQSKNSTDGLDDGDYTYFAYASDNISNDNQTETRTITIGENSGYLEVSLIEPTNNKNIAQNTTFTVNATVTCRGGSCGSVAGTVRYNGSSLNPDTGIPASDDRPFYIMGSTTTQSCQSG